MTRQAGSSPKRCFGRAGTADSRRRLRGGPNLLGRAPKATSIASFPFVPGLSFFSFRSCRFGAGHYFDFFRACFQDTPSFLERFCHKSEKAKNLQECFCTLFLKKNAFWTFFRVRRKNFACNLHAINMLRPGQKFALYMTEMNFNLTEFSAFYITTCYG